MNTLRRRWPFLGPHPRDIGCHSQALAPRRAAATAGEQILTGIHWAEEPPSRICHLISNVQVVPANPAGAAPSEIAVKSRFLVYRNRVETETDFLVGKREDLLRRVNGSWKIARRKIVLDQNVLLAKNLTVFF